MLQRVWTIPTVLSISRIVLLAPLAYFLFSDLPNRGLWGASTIVLAGITDVLDGFIARRLHQVTDFGKIIDPLADKICAGVCSVLLVMVGALSLWYLVVVVVRDLLILTGSVYIKSKKNIITQSNWPGKVAVFFIATVMLLSTIGNPSLEGFRQVMIVVSVVLMAVSLLMYVQRLFVGNSFARRNNSG